MATPSPVHRKAAELCKSAVRMTTLAGAGHPSSALSLAHIVVHLMYERMRWRPDNPWDPNADRLVLSEGHAVPIVYAALADLGARVGVKPDKSAPLSPVDTDALRDVNSVLDGHPNPAEGVPFFDAATGSLGQGLSVAAGLGLSARLDGRDRTIYAIVGDGESREGQIWEALDFIVDARLTNVVVLFNANGQGQAGFVSAQQSADALAAKLAAFGFDVALIDGHDPDAVAAAFGQRATDKPRAIVARTVKGWGVEALQKGNWHGKPVPQAELQAVCDALDAIAAQHRGGADVGRPPAPSPSAARAPVDPSEVRWPTFAEAMEAAGHGAALAKGQIATRRGYGVALKVAGDLLPQVTVLDADVSNSTFTDQFAKAHAQRFVECKIAEQNMASVGVGISAAGRMPFCNSFAKFISRAFDQVELASISRANLKLVGSHAGVSPSSDGPSQMGLVDVAFFRAFTNVRGDDRRAPLCWMHQPADAVAAYKLTQLMTRQPGMAYMRTHRPDVPLLYREDTTFEPGGFHVLSPGDDLALVSAGFMVHECRKALERLSRQNIRAALFDMYSLPFDGERVVEALRRCGGLAVVVEDNYGGGLGAAVAEAAARVGGVRVRSLVCQRIPKSALTPDDELDYVGLSAAQIADHAMAAIKAQ